MRGGLVVAVLAGGLVALPANSVGTRQVKDHSLLAVDFKRGQIPQAVMGAPGPQGPQGPPGITSTQTVLSDEAIIWDAVPLTTIRATCPSGTILLSGGFVNRGANADIFTSAPEGNSWVVVARRGADPPPGPGGPVSPAPAAVTARAICSTS